MCKLACRNVSSGGNEPPVDYTSTFAAKIIKLRAPREMLKCASRCAESILNFIAKGAPTYPCNVQGRYLSRRDRERYIERDRERDQEGAKGKKARRRRDCGQNTV